MKVLCAEYNQAGEVALIPVGDDVLLRNNDDFYIPDFTTEVSCVPQLVVRLCKLGKSVSERFAKRYYEEVGVGVRFYADDFEKKLRTKGLPEGMASSFGGSAVLSVLTPVEEGEKWEYVMYVNGKIVFESKQTGLSVNIEKLIALASDFHTLKIGDFLYCGNYYRHRGLRVNDRIEIVLNDRKLVDFRLK